MEYHNQIPAPHNQMNPKYGSQYGPASACNGLSLPDASSSSEKALMWSATGYMSESGYSTQAPSISSIDAFLNNEQMDNTMHNLDNASTISGSSTVNPVPPQPMPVQQQQQIPMVQPVQQPASYAQLQSVSQPSAQPVAAPTQPIKTEEQNQPTEDDNAVANWMNYQEDSQMAIKAIPELLKLLCDEDLVVVQQATVLLNQFSRQEVARIGLIQTPHAIPCLLDCLHKTADIETARNLVGALYGISAQKGIGVQAILNSKALEPVIKMLSAPTETIISYAITTLHNVLLDCGDIVKMQIRKMGALHQIVQLLDYQNVKFLSIAVDCLHLLTFGNQESKQIMLETGGTSRLVTILNNHNSYQKLILNTTRLLKVLSVCQHNKQRLIQDNCMQTLSMLLLNSLQNTQTTNAQTSHDILQNTLITLRNLSDSATRLNGLEQLIQSLVNLMASTNDNTILTLAVGILSNLTCNNESNKKTAVRSNGVQVLLKIIQSNLIPQRTQLLDPCLCALRHITNRHGDMLLAQEQIRALNGLSIVLQVLTITPTSWACVKALLGLIRNLCGNQLNQTQLRSNNIIEKLMQVLYNTYNEVNNRTNGGLNVKPNANLVVKLDDTNLLDIIDSSSAVLLMLAKEYQNQIIMKALDCIAFFIQMVYSPIANNQKAGFSLLAELATNPVCADVIEQQVGLIEYVQANFCNQFGMLKSIAEVTSGMNGANNTNVSIILQHVTTLMQRLQEHKNARNQQYMQQQQEMVRAQQQQQQQQQQVQYPPQPDPYGQNFYPSAYQPQQQPQPPMGFPPQPFY